MKKIFFTLLLILLSISPLQHLMAKHTKASTLNAISIQDKLKKDDPYGMITGHTVGASNIVFYWSGDPLPIGSFVSIDGSYDSYKTAGPGGNTAGSFFIPVSAFGGSGTHSVVIRYYGGPTGDTLLNYTLEYIFTL